MTRYDVRHAPFAPILRKLGERGVYEGAFISKLNDSEGEAAETQTWVEFSVKCNYLGKDSGRELFKEYDEIISMLISMISKPNIWVLPSGKKETRR